jgi:hypothetical protein
MLSGFSELTPGRGVIGRQAVSQRALEKSQVLLEKKLQNPSKIGVL